MTKIPITARVAVCLRAIAVIVVFLVPLSACFSAKAVATLHSVNMENEGPTVFEYRISYGNTAMPDDIPDPEFSAGGGSVYVSQMPVPESAEVSWKTEDQRRISYVVPIRANIRDPNNFRGTVFFVSNLDSLSVYVAYDGLTSLRKAAKIYSSAGE